MDPGRYSRVKELFAGALERPPGERAAYVDQASGGDAALAREVEELLAHADAATAFLGERPAAAAPGDDPAPDALRIPGFRLERVLGRGGMGVVYLAEQESPRRLVAVKCLRPDSVRPGELARFQLEADILGRLSHPGIAHVHGSGLGDSDAGPVPWIAMEYVTGVTLKEYVARTAPELRELLRLFVGLCAAVAHAHHRGVVHRDLKPSNVLVDDEGRVRVLDFGVARLLGDAGDGTNPHTRTGQLLGTLAYMSPEQARGEGGVGARSDVYALGVLLHELLTGEPPYALDEGNLLRSIRTICEEEPERLRRRRPDAAGDLETIVQQALEKEPPQRYADAGELRDDLERFLAGRPIAAHPPSRLYQVRKLVRRNPGLAASVAAVVGALAVAVAVLGASGRRVQAQLAETSATVDFFAREVFDLIPRLGFDPGERGKLEGLERRIRRQLEVDPGNHSLREARAQALFELASLDLTAKEPALAEARAEESRRLWDELIAEEPGDLEPRTRLSAVLAKLGEARRDLGDEAGMERWFRRALELDEELVRESGGDPELVEDLGWSLCRMLSCPSVRDDPQATGAFVRRRVADGDRLVALEPENWKYVYNLSHALHFAAGLDLQHGDLGAARRAAEDSHRLAVDLCTLQPNRRDFLLWQECTVIRQGEIARAAGDPDEARRAATLSFSLALALALAEPCSAESLGRIDHAANVAFHDAREAGDPDLAERIRMTLGDVLALARARSAPEASILALKATVSSFDDWVAKQ